MITVGVIGLSPIACGYPIAHETHIGAIEEVMPGSKILTFDTDSAAQRKCSERFHRCPVHVRQIYNDANVIVIASPTHTHAHYIREIVKHHFAYLKIIVCEKPLCETAEEGQELVDLCKWAGIPLIVNFQRRWLPGVQNWLSSARQGEWGLFKYASVNYTGEESEERIIRDASHGFDLIGAAGGEAYCSGNASEFSVSVDFEISRLEIGRATDMRPPWRNIHGRLTRNDPLVCAASDCIPGMKLVDQAVAQFRRESVPQPGKDRKGKIWHRGKWKTLGEYQHG